MSLLDDIFILRSLDQP